MPIQIPDPKLSNFPEDGRTSSLQDFVARQTEINRKLWYSVDDEFPTQLHDYSQIEKNENERFLSEQLEWFSTGIDRKFTDETCRKNFTATAWHRLRVTGMNILGLTYEQISVLEKEKLSDMVRKFYLDARKFDPDISTTDIFQASRNVWTAGYLQVLLNLEVKLSPSIFAYSILYPVTDNFLDDPNRDISEKSEFNQWFCLWLQGDHLPPRNTQEGKVRRLIQMIEGQFPRSQFKQVYEGLLAIHCAQDLSLRLLKGPVKPYSVDVLGITIAKGGTSVLADGILAAGELTEAQMKIIFNYGVFAQFMDDQEDLPVDLHENALTVFSEAARVGKIDRTMNRLFSFSNSVLKHLDVFSTLRSKPLIQSSIKGIDLLLIDAIARTDRFYSKDYLHRLENYFPVRFNYMKELRKRIEKKRLTLERVVSPFFVEVESNQIWREPAFVKNTL